MEQFDIETLVLFGVWWNAVLQTVWFVWSLSQHYTKHKED